MADDKMSLAGAVALSAGTPIPEQVPILPLRDTVLLPQSALPLGAGRESSVRLLEDVIRGGRLIGVFTQRDPTTEDPQQSDLHRVGTLATVHKVLKQPDGTVRLVVQGLHRVRISEVVQVRPYLTARIVEVPDVAPPAGDLETEALARNALNLFRQVVELSPMLPDELATAVQSVTQPDRLGDLIAATLPALTTQVKQELLETPDVKARLARLVSVLTKEAEVLALGSKIQSQVESEVGRSQREYYLREQLKAIQKELGQADDRTEELDDLRAKIEAAGMTEEAHKEALRELDRLTKMPPAAAEYTVARTYLDWLVALPWSKQTTDNLDIHEARRVLDEDHSGLEKVKDRILEYLAVKSMRPAGKDPILCFVGPPGVGKTSLGRSIARALGRKFHRISLGGMRDEAEIRGHRRTYIGALPGQIVQGLRRAATRNPVFMLDEIDKLGADFRGDPASALLEVLDPEQNASFRDHYLDVPFDLSRVLFITTANVMDTVPVALRDRMEVIPLAGYTEEEKVRIARRHLVPKQAREHGLAADANIEFTPEALRLLARGYTRESGVR
ncbi:MAG: endopeptidase La, partial [Candidatus Rokuibacteriota bacterium]